MGKGGRPRKPTALKVLEGNPGKRKLPENEPKPKPVMPDPPDWLSEEAQKFWNEYAPKLNQLGLFTEIDGAAFSMIAESWADWVKYRKIINRGNYKNVTDSGYEQQTVEVTLAKNAIADVKSFLSEFGMTPSSRSRIDLKLPGDDGEDMDDLLTGVK